MGALWKGTYWMFYQGKKNKNKKFCDNFYTVHIWKARWITLCWAPPAGFMSVYTFTRCIVDPDQTYQVSHLTEIVDPNRGITSTFRTAKLYSILGIHPCWPAEDHTLTKFQNNLGILPTYLASKSICSSRY